MIALPPPCVDSGADAGHGMNLIRQARRVTWMRKAGWLPPMIVIPIVIQKKRQSTPIRTSALSCDMRALTSSSPYSAPLSGRRAVRVIANVERPPLPRLTSWFGSGVRVRRIEKLPFNTICH